MNLHKFIRAGILIFMCAMVAVGCRKLQRDYNREPHPLNPHVNMTAWDYLKQRALGNNANDTIWKRFYEGIIYSGIDTNEYTKPGRTYIFLNNDAVTRTNSNLADVGFFGANLVATKTTKAWTEYPKDFVKAYLQYLILDGVYDHYTLPATNTVEVSTLAPAGSLSALPANVTRNSAYPFTPNMTSKLKIKILNSSPSNTSDYPIVLNESRNVRTSSILVTNGTIHAIDRFLTTTNPD